MLYDENEYPRHAKPPRLWLTEARITSGKSLARVAEEVGVTKQLVSLWERGLRKPGLSRVLPLSKAISVPADDLLYRFSHEAPPS